VDDALQRIRDLSHGLRPLMLDDLGLAATLRWYLDLQARKTGLDIHFSNNLPIDHLCSDVQTTAFRIVQESLTNVIRHSGARRVSVTLGQEDRERVRLTVKDDGCGFDAPQMLNRSASHLGLVGMQERVRLLGGSIAIASSQSEGTTIQVTLPCPCFAELP
jgi:signal transduction histidine kinase